MLSPVWATIPLGTLRRRELDLRTYHDLFRSDPYEIRGIRALTLRLLARKVPEDAAPNERKDRRRPTLVMFAGWDRRFVPLSGWHEFLHERLRAMTKDRWLEKADAVPSAPIGIHVRGGDFSQQGTRTPIEWFSDSLKLARDISGRQLEAVVVSDARSHELRSLLELPAVRLVRTGAAVSDLLALSRCELLLGSSNSTFSAWAAFLGQKPIFSATADGMTSLGLAEAGPLADHLVPASPSAMFEAAVLGLDDE